MILQQGDRVGQYEIDAAIGQGGMAAVYKAYHERLDRYVAIKMMHETFLQDTDFRERFVREARIVARLEHPNIVPIYDYDEYSGIPYLVMRLVDGMTLKRRSLKKGCTLAETAAILTDVASALDYAHSVGVLHRDMKPSNIILSHDDRPYITDFGLARIADTGASTISHDMMLGTPYYISPEQAHGEKTLDHRTDIYSLGVILYELVAGRVPFMADTPYAIVHGHIYQQPEPPSTYNETLSPEVDAVLARALAKDPDKRYDSATAMIQAFKMALDHSDVKSPDESIVVQTPVDHRQSQGDGDVITDPRTGEDVRMTETGRKVRLESSFDMGNIDFGDLGRRLGSGVQNITSMIEERIDSELKQRNINLTEEERVRRQVEKRLKKRQELAQHIMMYLMVNGVLWFIMISSGHPFPWPIFPTVFWGMGVVGDVHDYYTNYGPGAKKREETIEREVERELERRGSSRVKKKTMPVDAARLEDLQDGDRNVRINKDGEFTDSFVEEQFKRN